MGRAVHGLEANTIDKVPSKKCGYSSHSASPLPTTAHLFVSPIVPSRAQVHHLYTDAPHVTEAPCVDNVVLLLRAISSMLQYPLPKCLFYGSPPFGMSGVC